MRGSGRVRLFTALALAASAIISPIVGTGGAAAAPPRDNDALVRQLVDASRGSARIDKHDGTDKVRFVGTPAGKAIRRPSGVAADAAPEVAARAFFNSYGRLFGVRDAARELAVTKTRTGTGGVRTVRLQQSHDGIPVVGGDLVVQLEGDNDIVSAYGETTSRPATSKPSVTAKAARAAALGIAAKSHRVAATTLRAAAPELAIYDPQILGAPGRPGSRLVWRTEVTAVSGKELREFVLVDAARGSIALHFNQLAHATAPQKVCDKANFVNPSDACDSPISNPASSAIADVRNAHKFAEQTFDFYFDRFGRNSINNAGMTITSVVRYCPPGFDCPTVAPFKNAYWNGTHMVYGDGFASADDVVGHELAHGVTEDESHLFYYYQSGAINESLSDVFGEYLDLTNDDPLSPDPAGDRWLLGEDLPPEPGQPNGAIRNMADPTAFNDPDKMTSLEWDDLNSWQDRGGVHGNSGVNNKAAFLIVDGGTFNGRTVNGIGVNRAARIYYDAALMLTSASEYPDLNNILGQACDTAAAAGIGEINTNHCEEVREALLAVEMHLQPPTRTTTGVFAPNCLDTPGSTFRATQFSDNLETPSRHATNWARSATRDHDLNGTYTAFADPIGRWYLPQTSNPYFGWNPTYATSGRYNMWGDDYGDDGSDGLADNIDASIARRANVVATPTTFLQFNHAYGFEWSGLDNFDAGRVEYSTNNGANWSKVPNSWFTDNGYNGVVTQAPPDFANFDSLFAGSDAFVRDSQGYTTSRINLGALAGQNVRFRFRMASDVSGAFEGWYIDDISVYACLTAPFKTGLTTARSHASRVYGQAVTVSGRLTHQHALDGIAGQTVKVYGRRDGGSSWTLLGSRTTTSTGAYSLVHKPTRNFEYTARYTGSGDFLTSNNPAPLDVRVAPKVTAAFTDSTISRTGYSYLRGAVAPSHAGRRIYLQRYSSGAWRTVTSKLLSSTSKYSFKVQPGRRGTFKYRTVINAHSDHIAGKSPTRSLSVS